MSRDAITPLPSCADGHGGGALSVEEALARIHAEIAVIPGCERIALRSALGRRARHPARWRDQRSRQACFEDRELLKQFQEVEQLLDEDKNVVKKLLDAFLTQEQLQALAR